MVFNDDGTELWFTGTSNDSIKKITLATPYDYTTNVGTSTNTVSSADLNAIQDPVVSDNIPKRTWYFFHRILCLCTRTEWYCPG